MKALIAVGVFWVLTGIGLLVLSRTGLTLTSETDVRSLSVIKSKAKTRSRIDVSPIPGYVALAGGLICMGIGVWGVKKKIP